MNIDFINALIDRLITVEDATDSNSARWPGGADEELVLEINQDIVGGDCGPFRVQRLPKLDVRRPFLINSSVGTSRGNSGGEEETSRLVNSGKCFCQQLPYSACLKVVHGRQQELAWVNDTTLSENEDVHMQTFTDLVRHVWRRILSCIFIRVGADGGHRTTGRRLPFSIENAQNVARHPNIAIPMCIIETDNWFYAVTPISDCWVTLRDAALFSSHVVRDDSDRLLFVIYQLISTLVHCQTEANFLFTDLRLDAVRINANDFWCRLDVWRYLQYLAKSLTLTEDCEQRWPLGVWCDRWTRGLLSNFDYLNILNAFAGRRTGDPYYHPIFPWVCDFTRDPSASEETQSTNAAWRDLTKTKFRLTKGDQQLDQTFAGQQGTCGDGSKQAGPEGRSASISVHPGATVLNLPPHHVTEFLSDIGYYAYRSRRTPKSILCRHVRHRWVPEEYPCSLARLYHWTPDEAIPEFYSDPDIFVSVHPDLLDLELPDWFEKGDRGESRKGDGPKFIAWHRDKLESDRVSGQLHSWIDLIFGYKLTGQAAVIAKNVQLRLVERTDRLSNNGVVQLFKNPHPKRQSKTNNASASSASLDDVMNPLYDMEHLQIVRVNDGVSASREELDVTLSTLPADVWKKIRKCQVTKKTSPLVRECLTSLGILLAELCHSEAFRQLPLYASSSQRLQAAKKAVFSGQSCPLPRCVRFAVELLLDPSPSFSDNFNVTTPAVDSSILCPGLILQPLLCLIPFPYYMAPLYDCFRRVRSLELEFEELLTNSKTGDGCDFRPLVESAEKRVREVAKLLPLVLPHMSITGVELLARLTKRSLFVDPYARVLAMWLLWNPLTQALGPNSTDIHLMDCLIDLYDVESPCSHKFLKLYHRTFLLQLSVRLGVQRFLENLIQPLVEAAAGERDPWFYEDDDQYWKSVIDCNNSKAADGNEATSSRQLRFSLPVMENRDYTAAVENSPIVARKRVEQPDDIDSVEQFQLDITEEGNQQQYRRNSSSLLDFDPNAATVDVVSIRSSESGFSAGGAGMSSSFSLSKNDCDEDEFNGGQSTPQQMNQQTRLSVSDVAEESLLWLAHRLGPLLTARYVTKNLLRMLALCYSSDRLEPVPLSGDAQFAAVISCWYPVVGDSGAGKVLHCLEEIAAIYGEHMILRHYFAYAGELIAQALKRLTPNMEMAVLACVALIRRTFPYLTHEQLMENLKDHTFVDTLLFPLIRAASSIKVTFSSTATRTTLTWKLAECLYWLGVRVGAENVKTYLFVLVQRLFCTYDILYELETSGEKVTIKDVSRDEKRSEWSDTAFVQLKATFTPVLACRMLKAFGALCGKQYLQLSLSNSDLLAKICARYDVGLTNAFSGGPDLETRVAGHHRISTVGTTETGQLPGHRGDNSTEVDLVCKRLKHSSRKLKGTWLAYWEYELGRNPKEVHFNFKQMRLQSFVGHSGTVRKIRVLDNENSFVSAGHDKSVKLWSLRSTGDGGARTSCQYSYKSHKRPLWDLAFIDSLRLIASVDGSVHIWDPFMGVPIREFDFGDSINEPQQPQQQAQMATIVEACTAPSTSLLVAGTVPSLRFLDVRQAKWAHEFTIGLQRNQATSGPVRALCVDPTGGDRWVAIGHGLGHVSTLDMRTGRLLGQMKLCETDIFAMSSFDKETFIVCPFDQPMCMMRARDCSLQCRIPSTSDAIIAAMPFYQELVCATQSNRLRVYTSLRGEASFTDSKLRADMFAGAVSTLRLLPLNRLLLLGSTTGNIELLC